MNELTIFNFEEKEVRTIVIDEEPWFVASDICNILEISNNRNATNRLDDDEKDVRSVDTPGGKQDVTIVNESGLYSLILRSRKEEAKRFKKWVTSEVLPSIRKTGSYNITESQFDIPKNYKEALLLAYNQQVQIEEQQLQIEELTPKGEFYDTVVSSDDAIDMGSAAKILNMGLGRNGLFEFLRDNGVLMGNNQPYQKHIDAGHFRTIESQFICANGDVKIYLKTVVLQKGLDYIRKLLKAD